MDPNKSEINVTKVLDRHKTYRKLSLLDSVLEEIVSEIAKETGEEVYEIRGVIKYLFKAIVDNIKIGDKYDFTTLPVFLIIHLGKFIPSKSKYIRLSKKFNTKIKI